MLVNQIEPSKDHPCTVLFDRGCMRNGGRRLVLVEYEWRDDAWRRTEAPERLVGLKEGLREADWTGRLPEQGRKRLGVTQDRIKQVSDLLEKGLTPRQIESRLGIGRKLVQRMIDLYSV